MWGRLFAEWDDDNDAFSTMNQIDARELMRDVIPKLRATRHLIETVVNERRRLSVLQDEFALEMTMIRINLEHLLKRYSDQLAASGRDERHFQSPILTMDDAKRLYARAYQQTE